jgi:hypothetical protein
MIRTMKLRPRFSLRSFLVAIAIIGILLSWVVRQIDWIRRRHNFIAQHPNQYTNDILAGAKIYSPWPLWITGEPAYAMICFLFEDEVNEAKQLFPESRIDTDPWPANWPSRSDVKAAAAKNSPN